MYIGKRKSAAQSSKENADEINEWICRHEAACFFIFITATFDCFWLYVTACMNMSNPLFHWIRDITFWQDGTTWHISRWARNRYITWMNLAGHAPFPSLTMSHKVHLATRVDISRRLLFFDWVVGTMKMVVGGWCVCEIVLGGGIYLHLQKRHDHGNREQGSDKRCCHQSGRCTSRVITGCVLCITL